MNAATQPTSPAPAKRPWWFPRVLRDARVAGVDLARCVALFGMIATHVFPDYDDLGEFTAAHQYFSGRASVLFCFLAGVALTLTSAPGRPGARRAIVTRAVLIGALGLTLPYYSDGIAIILVNYAVLFVVGALFVNAPRWALFASGGTWLVAGPTLSHVLRQDMTPSSYKTPDWESFTDPGTGQLIGELVFTGYYPVWTWSAFLLVGMGVGRLPLSSWRVAGGLAVVGPLCAVGARVASTLLVETEAAQRSITLPLDHLLSGMPLRYVLEGGTYGTTPTNTWWWLVTMPPHSGTPFDAVHSVGWACGVLGVCLLVTNASRVAVYALLPCVAAGSMTLTLYSVHTIVYEDHTYHAQVIAALVAATVWSFTGRRGPLEFVLFCATWVARRTTVWDATPDDHGEKAVAA